MAFTAYNDIAAWTLGLPWKLAGKVDPFTQANLQNQEAEDLLKAQGIDPAQASQAEIDAANAQAEQDVSTTVDTTPSASIDCSKPDNSILTGIYCSAKKFESYIILILILTIAIYLLGKHFSSPRLIVRGGR